MLHTILRTNLPLLGDKKATAVETVEMDITKSQVKGTGSPSLNTLPLTLSQPTQGHQSNRCLAHCWLDDEQREQGQRCLVACWKNAHHSCGACTSGACATSHSDAEKQRLATPSHRCHSC